MASTINDIAKKAGVSMATVSRVLNDSGYVGQETRLKVEKAIIDLNYIPNAAARSLSKRETNVIGVLIPELGNPFFSEILEGISEETDQKNLNVILCNSDNNLEKEKRELLMLREQRIKGLILTPTPVCDNSQELYDFIKLVESLHIPVVLVDREVKYSDWDGVFLDNLKGAYEGVSALIKEGHRKIAILTGDQNLKIGRERLRGYKKALAMHDIPLNSKYIYYGDFTFESGYSGAQKILKMKEGERPTAIFVSNNMMNLGCLKFLFSKNIRIPEDMGIVAFDAIQELDIFNFNISVIARDTKQMGRIAMGLLLDRIQNGSDSGTKRIIISPELILKGSEKMIP